MTEKPPVLSIGSIEGGWSPQIRRWRDAITRLTNRVAATRSGFNSPLSVNIIFQVPGNILKPDFDGVRTGHFDRKNSCLIVQAALPEVPPDDVDGDLKGRLAAAIAEAEQWAQTRRVAEELSELTRLVQLL